MEGPPHKILAHPEHEPGKTGTCNHAVNLVPLRLNRELDEAAHPLEIVARRDDETPTLQKQRAFVVDERQREVDRNECCDSDGDTDDRHHFSARKSHFIGGFEAVQEIRHHKFAPIA